MGPKTERGAGGAAHDAGRQRISRARLQKMQLDETRAEILHLFMSAGRAPQLARRGRCQALASAAGATVRNSYRCRRLWSLLLAAAVLRE